MDDAFYSVGPGDVAHIPPDALRSVANESEDELKWAAFWWNIITPRAKDGSPAREEDPEQCNVFNDR